MLVVIGTWFLTGCWDRHELNAIAIVVGMGIDKVGNEFRVSVQIVNPREVSSKGRGGGGSLAPAVTFEETGATLPEAMRRMTVLSPRRLNFSHLRIIVFGEDVARMGIRKPLDYISRDSEMRNDFYLVVAEGASASEVLKTYSAMDPIPSNNLNTKLAISDDLWAGTGKITLNQLLVDMATQGKSAMMTGIRVTGNRKVGETMENNRRIVPEANLVYSGSAVFKEDRMIGWIDEAETKAVNYVQDSVKRTLGIVSCPDGGKISLSVVQSKSNIRIRMNRDTPIINVYLRVEQDVSDVECNMDMSQMSTIDWINLQGERKIGDIIDKAISRVKGQLGVDIFGFGVEVHRQQPKAWHRIKDWNEVFRHAQVNVYPHVITRRIGTILQSVEHQTKGRG
ncbi:Ger(x)C family spore germination protein [Cohnella silvisoli]|uniref:Ger(X)C family spore germination protein n=1 Tax=Cohnella silvisoli TaxID=2873699 RepID=A0ABV1KR14_9BACL|nr:Ger(x)C family spore germination protein [Cohnella silvisoli]MCD9024615.1 Ger(x)C family spore germination protein [Cohnella silvisoli]